MKKIIQLSTALFTLVLSGCGIGYNQTLFATTSNVGIDIDTKPPTAEISIARREGVIAPTFEGGQHPPVYASFGLKVGGFLPLTTDVSGLFAGGRAAVVVSASGQMKKGDSDYDRAGVLCLTSIPADSWLNGKFPSAGAVQPMYFGTDTTYGLKIAWSGTAGPYPDSVKLGYNRKEFALAPLSLTEHPVPGQCPNGAPYAVAMPSFLASVNSDLTAAGLAAGGSKFDYAQFFATGASADNLAQKPATRAAYQLKSFDAAATTDSAKKLVCFWIKDPKNGAKLTTFAETNHVTLTDLLYDQSNEALQKQAAETLSATCP